jgi:hypothetical protein
VGGCRDQNHQSLDFIKDEEFLQQLNVSWLHKKQGFFMEVAEVSCRGLFYDTVRALTWS